MKTGRLQLSVIILLFFLLFVSEATASTVRMHIDTGLNHFHRNRYLEAFREFKAAAEKDPGNPQAHYNLGRVYKAQGFYKEAMMQFQIALTRDPNYLAAQRELQAIKEILEKDKQSQHKLEGQKTVADTFIDSSQNTQISSSDAEEIARDLLSQGKIDEAMRYLQIILKERPHDAGIIKLIAFLHLRQNRLQEALDAYNRVEPLSPSDPEIPYSIGLIKMQTMQYKDAENCFKKALNIQPNMIQAIFALGEAFENQGKIEDAIFQFEKTLQLNPQVQDAEDKLSLLVKKQTYNYFTRGSYFYQQGDYAQAEPLLSLALNYGSLTEEQLKQSQEMVQASRYWLDIEREKQKAREEALQTRTDAYLGQHISVEDVARTPSNYLGKAIEWEGKLEYTSNKRGKLSMLVNSKPSVNIDSNMDFAFEIQVPKELPKDPRIAYGAEIEVHGRVKNVERLHNQNSNIFSSRRQPVIEATEIVFRRHDHAQPLIVRFY